MDFGEKQKALVMQSWELIQPNLGYLSVRFFTEILDNIPEARDMFYFLKDKKDSHHNNHKMKTHALVLLKLTCNSVVRLQDKGDIALPEDALKKLGSIHLAKNVKDSHFEVMREALLRIVHEGVGDQWSDDLGKAWELGYDKLADAIKMKMKE
ncbi:non-symbiotic hemoglobin 2 [Dendrobium catenatum]|uniref:Non-symbiotic hemoglobin 2 n=1 Tax=Dendrobium catenatum TaxID=906689 RepID=A0A2I0WX41_9ASPA|nr:non-symbiotic hemoglobin 2 [Dendrobium catenatum]PKU80221.1 Non-symbiotic hemoglobin 2 [Dendrobium catenatum]